MSAVVRPLPCRIDFLSPTSSLCVFIFSIFSRCLTKSAVNFALPSGRAIFSPRAVSLVFTIPLRIRKFGPRCPVPLGLAIQGNGVASRIQIQPKTWKTGPAGYGVWMKSKGSCLQGAVMSGGCGECISQFYCYITFNSLIHQRCAEGPSSRRRGLTAAVGLGRGGARFPRAQPRGPGTGSAAAAPASARAGCSSARGPRSPRAGRARPGRPPGG